MAGTNAKLSAAVEAYFTDLGRVRASGEATAERSVYGPLNDASSVLGERTFDIYLNADPFWRNVPETVWNYRPGGYQVLKKWLSYPERHILGRPLKIEEVQHFSDMARRIQGFILSMPHDLSTQEGYN